MGQLGARTGRLLRRRRHGEVMRPRIIQYNKSYAVLIARVIDIAISTFVWRDYDITISAQTGLLMRRADPPRWARVLNAFLNWIETNHCNLAIACDIERAQQALRILTGAESP